MKFNYGKIFLLGFGFFGVSVIWGVYNAFVPVFLADRFQIEPALIGFFMTLDNIAALFIQPPVGAWSDRLRTPIGRRMPFILIGAPVAAIAFGLIPLAAILPLFVACTTTLILSMAFWRTPVVALMPDITPSAKRSQANGIINFMGGLGAIISFLGGSALYKMNPAFPFWLGSALVVLAALLVFIFIKEPKFDVAPETASTFSLAGFRRYLQEKRLLLLVTLMVILLGGFGLTLFFPEARNVGANLGIPPYVGLGVVLVLIWFVGFYAYYMAREPIHDQDKSALRLFLAIFAWFVGYNAIEAFFTLYAVNHLGMHEADGARLLGHLSLFFVLFALVAGFIGGKFGRRRTIMTGVSLLALLIATIFFLPVDVLTLQVAKLPILGAIPVISLFLMASGIAWALININSLPMVVDLVEDARIGTYTGLYYLFSTMAAIAGPNINGWIVQLTGKDYNNIMLVAPLFMLLALLSLGGVRRGEAK
ncbi:MAG: MFS transporter [Anaerolineales bacterium]|nr:MFS transporter [Anaerolineales bacterium]MCX7607857.1 MFS transporter [Anaerolineales bacterium]MDW8226874.1 MFS transporter [Anaerolineales bacterium]